MELVRTHDQLFRFVFGEPAQMAELLQSQLPAALTAAIDWSTLRRIDGSFVDKALQDRLTDLLFVVQVDGHPLLLHTLVDHKSRADWATALQLARYTLRIHDRWLADHPDARSLPPVLPFVVHHGTKPWQAARSVDELVDLSGFPADVADYLRPLQLRLPFVLLDLATMDEAAVDGMRVSLVAGMTLRFLTFLRGLDPKTALAVVDRWIPLLTALRTHPRGGAVLCALLYWYASRVGGDPQDLRVIMNKIYTDDDDDEAPAYSVLDQLLDEGRAEGEQLGMRHLLESLLRSRFGAAADAFTDRLTTADLATLQRWGERLLRAEGIDDVFAG